MRGKVVTLPSDQEWFSLERQLKRSQYAEFCRRLERELASAQVVEFELEPYTLKPADEFFRAPGLFTDTEYIDRVAVFAYEGDDEELQELDGTYLHHLYELDVYVDKSCQHNLYWYTFIKPE